MLVTLGLVLKLLIELLSPNHVRNTGNIGRSWSIFFRLTAFRRFGSCFVAILGLSSLYACGGGGSASPSGVDSAPLTNIVAEMTIGLSWLAPVEREDGHALALNEIVGYRIYYGTSSGVYENSVLVEDAGTNSLDIDGIPVGTWYLVVTTLDADGLESAYSAEVVKEVAE